MCGFTRYVRFDVMYGFIPFLLSHSALKELNFFLTICEQVLIVHVFTVVPPRLSDPINFITVIDITLSEMLRLNNVPQAKVHADCFIDSL